MEFDLTILAERIEKVKAGYDSGEIADVLVTALNSGNGLMQKRIFTKNLDVNGQDFGKYIGEGKKIRESTQEKLLFGTTKTAQKRIKKTAGLELTSYQRKRLNRGRQIDHKDLELEGTLRRNIETGVAVKEDSHSAVLRFGDSLEAKIARGQEQQITNIRKGRKGTTKGSDADKIFALNESEKQEVIDQGVILFKKIIS